MRRNVRRIISLLLVLTLCAGLVPLQAFAEGAAVVALPETGMEEEILLSDVFYVASASAQLSEGSRLGYLLRIGRGGEAAEEASVNVRIADLTAKYGEDYTVRVYETGVSADNPDDNASLMEMMENESYTQSSLGTEEELAALLDEDEEGQDLLNAGVQAAVSYLDEASGLAEKYPDGYPAEQIDEVQQARAAFTGVDGVSQKLSSQSDTFRDMQSVADVLTQVVVGAELTLTFAPGVREQYLELIPKDNGVGDGSRMFYLVLNHPEGSTTVSGADSCAVTIIDDEEQMPSVVSFSATGYAPTDGSDTVTVKLERSGAMNTVVSVLVRTTGEGSALAGRDYSEVDTELLFPFGVPSLTLDIPVCTSYFEGEADFALELEAETGCTIGNGSASVTLRGTYEPAKAAARTPAKSSAPKLMSAPKLGSTATATSSLATIRTGSAIDVSQPYTHGHEDNYWGGKDYYDSNAQAWHLEWMDNSSIRDRKGTVGAIWKLSDDSHRLWCAGVQVVWEMLNGSHPDIGVMIDGHGTFQNYYSNWEARGKNKTYEFCYYSNKPISRQTVNFYPTEDCIKKDYAYSPKWIAIYNHARCDDCKILNIYSIKPILRPYYISLQPADELKFLTPDGAYATGFGAATNAEIVGAGSTHTVFLDESFTVAQPGDENVQQYTMLKSLKLDNGGNYVLGSNSNAANKSISYTLTKDAMATVVKKIGGSVNAIKENKFITQDSTTNSYGYATYYELDVKPEFAYIDSSVTLRNPYDYPVTMVVSGKEYPLEPHTETKATYHLGDQLAVSVKPGDAAAKLYTASAVHAWLKSANEQYLEQDYIFSGNAAVYPGASTAGTARRLCYKEMILEPRLQEKGNSIRVRVKTSDLSKLDAKAGFLKGSGTAVGEYTEYLFADADQTANGQLYFISAPAEDGYVSVWQDQNTNRTYEGDTLYFTAGGQSAKNIITLTAEPAKTNVTFSGTLRYMNYNLRAGDTGNASALPASGAVIAAGSASAVAGDNGFFSIGSEEAIHATGVAGRYLRYLVSVNGNALTKEVALPRVSGNINLTNSFPDGVSPVSSEIFSGLSISASYPAGSGYSVEGGTYLPIVEGVPAKMQIQLSPAEYTILTSGETGVAEQAKTETPLSVILTVYDDDGHWKGSYPSVEFSSDDSSLYTASVTVDTAVEEEIDEGQAQGEDATSGGGGFSVQPGDMLYLRLTTDRLSQAAKDEEEFSYSYSDIYTGFTFIAPVGYEAPVMQGFGDDPPVKVQFPSLPLLDSAGMNLSFPFVTVGWKRIDKGYRMYIGVSPVQIVDSLKGTHVGSYTDAFGMRWTDQWSIKSPISSYLSTMKDATVGVWKELKNGDPMNVMGELGAPQWKFNLTLGAYFDFYTPEVLGITGTYDNFYFAGVGFYMSVSIGFKVAWYFVVPVVFIPVYIGLNIDATILGFLGAAATGDIKDYNDWIPMNGEHGARQQSVEFDKKLSEFSGSVRGIATVQLSAGIGICGVVGVRAVGRVDIIADYTPSDILEHDWGAMIEVGAYITLDLLLASVPIQLTSKRWPYGSFDEYLNGTPGYEVDENGSPKLMGARNSDPFILRTGSETASNWVGDKPLLKASLTPATTSALSVNTYERADAQLITLDNGTIVLAYIESDIEKGPYQRTTLNLVAYMNGSWGTPVPVFVDNTADFQPSIAETKDGRVLAAWISTVGEIDENTSTVDYLNSTEVFAAFATVNGDGTITVDAPTQLTTGTKEQYYDSNPTVVCDKLSGDAVVYYVKSGSTSANATELANPYTNDCVIGYMYYNAEQDTDTKKDKETGETVATQTVPAGWLKEHYYYGEYSGTAPDTAEWGGQRFLNGPVFSDVGGKKVYYAIPDFTAIGYNGLSIFAYTVDKDSSSDTNYDKELYLQVFNFEQHSMKHLIRLTEDSVADAMPQFFRTKDAGLSTNEANTHTKLFWYRNDKNVCYIDVSRLIRDGIDDKGHFEPNAKDYTTADGVKHSYYVEPSYIGKVTEDGASGQMANFRVAEDGSGSLYVVWTEGVMDANGESAQQLFAMGMYSTADTLTDAEAGARTNAGNSGWSKPRQLTKGSYNYDDIAVTTCGDGLMVASNRYYQTLNVKETDQKQFQGVLDYDPIELSSIQLCATTLEPCGAVEVEDILLTYTATEADEKAVGATVELPLGGSDVDLTVTVANNGLTKATGYKLTLYAVQNGVSTEIGTIEITNTLQPTSAEAQIFSYTLPENVAGLSFRAVAQELRSGSAYYAETAQYETEPLECRADYTIENISTAQTKDGFRMRYTLTNHGNAAGDNDTLYLSLSGPFNMDLKYSEAERQLYSEKLESLGIGESRDYDVFVRVPEKMLKDYGFIDASAVVVRQDGGGAEQALSAHTSATFTLVEPMNLSVRDLTLGVNEKKTPTVSMALAQRFGGSEVSLAVEDQTVAAVQDGQLVGQNPGTTTLYVTHIGSGAVVSSSVTVTDQTGDPVVTQPVSGEFGNVNVSASVSGNTATVKEIPASEIEKVGSAAVSLDLSEMDKAIEQIRLPAAAVEAVAASASSGLAIRLSTGVVTFDAAAVDAISEDATGAEIALKVERIDRKTLTAEQKSTVEGLGNAAIIQATLTSGGKTISDFGGGSARITVPFEKQKSNGSVAVYYLDDAGKLTKMSSTYDAETKTISFVAPHFSEYVITELEALPFTDVKEDAYYTDAVRWAYLNQVTDGTSATLFSPEQPVSRAQVVTFLWRAAGCPEPTDSTVRFTDVPAGAYYSKAVAWAVRQGITKGTSDTTFGPDTLCTRAQVVTFLARFAGVEDADTQSVFSDVRSTDYFAAAVKWAKDNQVTDGTSATTFEPDKNCSRAQVVTFLYRWMTAG